MSVESAVISGRQAAERRMTSRCTIRRVPSDNPTSPNAAGFLVSNWTPVYTDLPLRLAGGSGFRTLRVGDSEIQVAVRVAHLPAATSDLRDGDLIEVTVGENAGSVLQVAEASWQDQATARRVPVFEVSRPEEWP